jgi:hypothetical protein
MWLPVLSPAPKPAASGLPLAEHLITPYNIKHHTSTPRSNTTPAPATNHHAVNRRSLAPSGVKSDGRKKSRI